LVYNVVEEGESVADEKDVRGLRAARTELSKRGIDISRADVNLRRGVLHIRGNVSAMRGCSFKDLKSEMELVARVLRQKSEIRDVVLDCHYSGL